MFLNEYKDEILEEREGGRELKLELCKLQVQQIMIHEWPMQPRGRNNLCQTHVEKHKTKRQKPRTNKKQKQHYARTIRLQSARRV